MIDEVLPLLVGGSQTVRLGQISLPTQPRLFRVNSTSSTNNCPRDNRGGNDQEHEANRDQHWNCRAATKWHVPQYVPPGMRSNQAVGNQMDVKKSYEILQKVAHFYFQA